MTYKPMNNREHALFLVDLATRLRESVGDHLKLLRLAAELDAKALDITDPKPKALELTGLAAEEESNRLAVIARGHDPEMVTIAPTPVPEKPLAPFDVHPGAGIKHPAEPFTGEGEMPTAPDVTPADFGGQPISTKATSPMTLPKDKPHPPAPTPKKDK